MTARLEMPKRQRKAQSNARKRATSARQKKVNSAFQLLDQESDRGCILVGAAFLEEMLEYRLRPCLRGPGRGIVKTIRDMHFDARIKLASNLKLLDDRVLQDLRTIAQIRNNYAAHTSRRISFQDPGLQELIASLRTHFGPEHRVRELDYRTRFIEAVARIGTADLWIRGFNERQVSRQQRKRAQPEQNSVG